MLASGGTFNESSRWRVLPTPPSVADAMRCACWFPINHFNFQWFSGDESVALLHVDWFLKSKTYVKTYVEPLLRGISIVAGLFVARGCGKQSGSCHFQSGPHQSSVRSNAIPDFRDLTMEFVTIYLWALYCPDFPT